MVEFVPASLGFDPVRFPSYRKNQLEIATVTVDSPKRFHCWDAAPGSGKSLAYLTAGLLDGGRILVLTVTKNLQSQVLRDAATLGAKDIRGAANYPCIALERGGFFESYGPVGGSCEEGPCRAGKHCSLREKGCHNFDAIRAAHDANIVIGNYSLWLSWAKHSNPDVIGKFDMLVLDEAHNAADQLVRYCAVELDRAEVKSALGLNLPPVDDGIDVWSSWAKEASAIAVARINEAQKAMKEFFGDKALLKKKILRLKKLDRGLAEMSKARNWKRTESPAKDVEVPGTAHDWIAYSTPRGANFSPVWAHQYAEEYLFRGIPKVVLSSGTLLPSVTKRLGIPPAQAHWHEVKSSFDPRRRPIIYVPTTRIDHRATEGQLRIWMNRIDRLLDDRLDRKTLIHSVSYARADYIKKYSRHAQHMLTHRPHETRQTIEAFKRSAAPSILVTPAAVEGIDFPFSEVRFIIIAKVPFASSADPVFKARCKADPDYRFECAALLIVQMVGRGMRAVDDWVECVIVDDHFSYLRYKTSWPAHVKAAWRQSDSLPKPLKLTA